MPTSNTQHRLHAIAALLLIGMALPACTQERSTPAQPLEADSAPSASSEIPARSPATASSPAIPATTGVLPARAARLQGYFEAESMMWAESWTQLQFLDEESPRDFSHEIFAVEGRGTPEVEAMIEQLRTIRVATASPEGKRIVAACTDGCVIEARIVEFAPGRWQIETLHTVKRKDSEQTDDVDASDPRRRSIDKVASAVVSTDLGIRASLRYQLMREFRGIAFVVAWPSTGNGRPIDFSRTPYADRLRDRTFGQGRYYMVLERRNDDWRLVDMAFEPTTPVWEQWQAEHHLPERLFEEYD